MTPATRTESTFSLAYRVEAELPCAPAVAWARLTDAAAFPSWNSTVTRIEGTIQQGQKLKIQVPISARTFTPTVTELEADRRMVWADGFAPMFKGQRTFMLEPTGEGRTRFVMEEVFSGLMLPMIKGSLPDFKPVFERYAADLAAACA